MKKYFILSLFIIGILLSGGLASAAAGTCYYPGLGQNCPGGDNATCITFFGNPNARCSSGVCYEPGGSSCDTTINPPTSCGGGNPVCLSSSPVPPAPPAPFTINLNTPLPGGPTSFQSNANSGSIASQYIKLVYNFLLGASFLLAMLILVFAGIKYIASEAVSAKQDSKDMIMNALLGILLLIGAAFILNIIRPLNLSLCDLSDPTSCGFNAIVPPSADTVPPAQYTVYTPVPPGLVACNNGLGVCENKNGTYSDIASCQAALSSITTAGAVCGIITNNADTCTQGVCQSGGSLQPRQCYIDTGSVSANQSICQNVGGPGNTSCAGICRATGPASWKCYNPQSPRLDCTIDSAICGATNICQ